MGVVTKNKIKTTKGRKKRGRKGCVRIYRNGKRTKSPPAGDERGNWSRPFRPASSAFPAFMFARPLFAQLLPPVSEVVELACSPVKTKRNKRFLARGFVAWWFLRFRFPAPRIYSQFSRSHVPARRNPTTVLLLTLSDCLLPWFVPCKQLRRFCPFFCFFFSAFQMLWLPAAVLFPLRASAFTSLRVHAKNCARRRTPWCASRMGADFVPRRFTLDLSAELASRAKNNGDNKQRRPEGKLGRESSFG